MPLFKTSHEVFTCSMHVVLVYPRPIVRRVSRKLMERYHFVIAFYRFFTLSCKWNSLAKIMMEESFLLFK